MSYRPSRRSTVAESGATDPASRCRDVLPSLVTKREPGHEERGDGLAPEKSGEQGGAW